MASPPTRARTTRVHPTRRLMCESSGSTRRARRRTYCRGRHGPAIHSLGNWIPLSHGSAQRYLFVVTAGEAALWALLGGFALEGFDTVDMMRRTGKWPWRTLARRRPIGPTVWLVSLAVREGAGAATAAAAASGDVIGNNVLGAFAIGALGPMALQSIIARTAIAAGPPPHLAHRPEVVHQESVLPAASIRVRPVRTTPDLGTSSEA